MTRRESLVHKYTLILDGFVGQSIMWIQWKRDKWQITIKFRQCTRIWMNCAEKLIRIDRFFVYTNLLLNVLKPFSVQYWLNGCCHCTANRIWSQISITHTHSLCIRYIVANSHHTQIIPERNSEPPLYSRGQGGLFNGIRGQRDLLNAIQNSHIVCILCQSIHFLSP